MQKPQHKVAVSRPATEATGGMGLCYHRIRIRSSSFENGATIDFCEMFVKFLPKPVLRKTPKSNGTFTSWIPWVHPDKIQDNYHFKQALPKRLVPRPRIIV
jgi:hypothetical protein